MDVLHLDFYHFDDSEPAAHQLAMFPPSSSSTSSSPSPSSSSSASSSSSPSASTSPSSSSSAPSSCPVSSPRHRAVAAAAAGAAAAVAAMPSSPASSVDTEFECDYTSASSSIGSPSRCGSPSPCDPSPMMVPSLVDMDAALPSLRFMDESRYAAGDILSASPVPVHAHAHAAASAAAASAAAACSPAAAAAAATLSASPVPLSRTAGLAGLTVMVPPTHVAGVVCAPAHARRVEAVRPGTAVHRAAVAPGAHQIVAAAEVRGAVFAASVVDAEFGGSGAAVAARVITADQENESVFSSSDADDADLGFSSRPRLASVSTSSMPGSPVAVAAASVHGVAFPFGSRARAMATAAVSVLGKRRAAEAVLPVKRPRHVYAAPAAAAAAAAPSSRLFVVYRGGTPAGPEGYATPALSRTFVVTDATDRIFTVQVGMEPSCSCAAFAGGQLCEHLAFVLVRVLKAPADSPFLTRPRLSVDEVRALFAAAPADPAAGHHGLERRRSSLVVRQGTDGRECSLCCESFRAGSLTYCMSGCGANFHQECMERWQAYGARTTTVVAAKVVSSGPEPVRRRAAAAAGEAEPVRDAEPLGVEPACCPVCRAQWKEVDDHLEATSPAHGHHHDPRHVDLDEMESLGLASPLGAPGAPFFDAFDFAGEHLQLVL